MRPPHFRQRVMSMAKTRARSFAHAMRRGRGEELGEEAGESSGWAKSSASCGGGGGAAGLGMTRATAAHDHDAVDSEAKMLTATMTSEAAGERTERMSVVEGTLDMPSPGTAEDDVAKAGPTVPALEAATTLDTPSPGIARGDAPPIETRPPTTPPLEAAPSVGAAPERDPAGAPGARPVRHGAVARARRRQPQRQQLTASARPRRSMGRAASGSSSRRSCGCFVGPDVARRVCAGDVDIDGRGRAGEPRGVVGRIAAGRPAPRPW